jgi:hypothetical protein
MCSHVVDRSIGHVKGQHILGRAISCFGELGERVDGRARDPTVIRREECGFEFIEILVHGWPAQREGAPFVPVSLKQTDDL